MSTLMLVNPRRKRRRKTTRKSTARANPRRRRRAPARRRSYRRRNPVALANPRRRRRRSYRRRNPRLSLASIQRQTLMPAVAGGVGALALDVIWGAAPLPAQVKTGAIGAAAKVAGAIVVGKVAGKAFGRKIGDAFTLGAVTIQAYNLVKSFAQQAMPNLPLGEYLSAAWPYAPTPIPYGASMGYVNAAPALTGDMHPYANPPQDMGEYLSDYSYSNGY